jgi:hypothetical protein
MCGFIIIEKTPGKAFRLSERYSLPLRCYGIVLELLPYPPVALPARFFQCSRISYNSYIRGRGPKSRNYTSCKNSAFQARL